MVERFLIGSVVLLIGTLFCFAGYRLFRVIMTFWGWLLGFVVGIQLVPYLLGDGLLSTILAWATGLVLGCVLALLAYALYAAAITLLGASFGYTLGVGLMTALGIGNQTMLVVSVGLVLAFLCAILVLALDLARLLIVANTALGGAATIVIGILLLLAQIPLDSLSFQQLALLLKSTPAWLVLWLGLAITGGVFQLEKTRHYQFEKYTLARKVSH